MLAEARAVVDASVQDFMCFVIKTKRSGARTRRIALALVRFASLREELLMARIQAGLVSILILPMLAAAQVSHRTAIRAGKLIDGKSDKVIENALILIENDKIVSVAAGGTSPAGVELIDLSKATVLPGFIDTHTHVLLQGDITAEEYDAQLLKESIPYRAILAARNAQIALSHGFTTIRDLETEGAMYADVDVKTAIANGEVPGPRMQVATRAMTPTGMYPLLGYSWELKVPTGVQYVDGVDGARRAVREQVMYGADWIKYYSDRRYHFEADGVLHSMVNFTDEEAKTIVDEAHRLGKKVAAHAIGSDGIAAALRAGVDTIEHGDGLTDALMDEMAKKGVYWVPTIAVGVYVAPGRGGNWQKMADLQRENFPKAIKKGVKIALGTDAGGFDWKQLNEAKEFEYYVQYGMTPMQAIRTGTSVAAELLGWSDKTGTIEAGKWADIVAVGGDPLKDITELQRVKFVMKGGAVYKNEMR
jgi:imidazolonepropionase-like amidohydrolase